MTTAENTREPVWRAFRWRVLFIAALAIVSAMGVGFLPRIPQSQSYHHFADDRMFLGVPNCLNVVSNLPFLIVGVWGLCFVGRSLEGPGGPFLQSAERWPFVLFFLGVGLTAFGSAYYHLQPDNDRLVWDRQPMSVAFMALVAAVLAERIDVKFGVRSLLPLVALGIGTVVYWHVTENQGRGDLRPYYFVQFYPVLALPLLLLLLPPRYTRTSDLFLAMGWYVVAKICEHPGDARLYALGHVVSGHTLKHLAAAAGAYWVLRMLRKRRPRLDSPSSPPLAGRPE
jgi:xanthine/uracil permease